MRFKPAVEAFAEKQEEAFTADDVVAAIRDRVIRLPPEPDFEVEDILEENEKLFVRTAGDESLIFVPRQTHFRGGHFLVVPTDSEVQGGYLVPGHRFLPFCAREMFPPQCRLSLEDGTQIPTRSIRLSLPEGTIYFSLMRPDEFMQYLVVDDPANTETLEQIMDGGTPPEWRLTVYDMTETYRRTGFRPGDAFVAEILSWREGSYRLKKISAEDRKPLQFAAARWYETLEKNILRRNEEWGPKDPPGEQIARAIWDCGPEALAAPGIHVGGFIGAMKELDLTSAEAGVFLWKKGEKPSFVGQSLFSGNVGSLDAILNDLAVSYDETEVEAFMRDALFHGGTRMDDVRDRILDRRATVFVDRRQKEAFQERMQELWDEVRGQYDRKADADKGPLRSELLAMIEAITETIRALDRKQTAVSDIPMDLLMALTSPMTILKQFVTSLNDSSALPSEDAEKIRGILGEMKFDIQRVSADLEAQTGRNSGGSRRERDQPAQARKVYQIKVSLKGIKPPIWRRILIGSDMTLRELHQVIQIAMGWTESHLHEFKIGSLRYGVAEDDGFGERPEDEEATLLADVVTGAKMKFRYEYDFGDSWIHELMVEKIVDPDAATPVPVCIGGARACPPEDCGGIHGYYDILETLRGPATSERQELREWLGGNYDAASFNMDAVNVVLRKMHPNA